ncbi:peroxidase 12-like [Gastrolobium bilobum]|uniref:peroxidase 12-like n=1 Tax=Gastrolobium bilobum TaxID=150636 RepID=UPI002AB223A6|nr:peroxidase 12-like [Gastrolobium bilobum]
MARVTASRTPSLYSLLLISSFLLASQINVSFSERVARPPIVKGLAWDFYWLSCPRLERIVRKHLEDVFEKDIGQAPGILRIFFHDCFPQGCDGSILLNGVGEDDEKEHFANAGLREEALQTIENLRALVRKQCPRVVTCADILVMAAREAVRQLGGPDFDVPLGRKDSLTFNATAPIELPPPFLRTDELLGVFGAKKFDATDVVALSGAHTYGRAHCGSLFNRTTESNPPIDPDLKKKLQATCPNDESPNTVDLDIRTPHKFDNMYYINLLNRQGVFTSDQDIATHPKTKEIVNLFASDQKQFFDKFANAFVKVSQLDVLTGNQGEVRKTCFAPNSRRKSVVDEVVELVEKF